MPVQPPSSGSQNTNTPRVMGGGSNWYAPGVTPPATDSFGMPQGSFKPDPSLLATPDQLMQGTGMGMDPTAYFDPSLNKWSNQQALSSSIRNLMSQGVPGSQLPKLPTSGFGSQASEQYWQALGAGKFGLGTPGAFNLGGKMYSAGGPSMSPSTMIQGVTSANPGETWYNPTPYVDVWNSQSNTPQGLDPQSVATSGFGQVGFNPTTGQRYDVGGPQFRPMDANINGQMVWMGRPNSSTISPPTNQPGQTQPTTVNPTLGTVSSPVSTQPSSVPQSTPDTNWFQNYMNRINYGFNFNYPNFANQSQDMGF